MQCNEDGQITPYPKRATCHRVNIQSYYQPLAYISSYIDIGQAMHKRCEMPVYIPPRYNNYDSLDIQ